MCLRERGSGQPRERPTRDAHAEAIQDDVRLLPLAHGHQELRGLQESPRLAFGDGYERARERARERAVTGRC
jgi:hypothetical protein